MEQEKYLPELMAEKDSLDPSFVHAMRLLADAYNENVGWREGRTGEKEQKMQERWKKERKIMEDCKFLHSPELLPYAM
ncbi:KH domain-containing, RNA-binding, signal transduction-associated protein 2 [Grus japonensis]|uniref:KH domain-containing, RNA-binding, signal transduction-associated protein 2 n=1 Tax=Grus japonensis TaxID=30415 RepID=A0ABC9WMV0_GRUJA